MLDATLSKTPVQEMSIKALEEIPLFKVHMVAEAAQAASEVLFSGYIGQGPKVALFEERLSAWFASPHVLALNSGTAAIHLALRLAGVGFGDEVVTTPMTCVATNTPILERGAKVVWADIDPWTGNIDPKDVARKITPRTKAVIAVHWGGYPCDLEELATLCRKHGVPLIEDAAHAFGSRYRGAPIGSHSDFVCFSFQAIKHLTTVDGGALVCRDRSAYDRGKRLRWFGIDREDPRRDFRCENDIIEHGYKFHMNDVAAAIGLAQLENVHQIIERHVGNAAFYRRALAELAPGFRLLRQDPDRESASWLFTGRVESRDLFMTEMKKRGVATSQVHARNDCHTIFAASRASLPGVDEFCAEQVSIPVGWWINDEQRARIVQTVAEVCRR